MSDARAESRPLLDEPAPTSLLVVLVIGVVVPFLALLAAGPIAWGWGLSWLDVTIAAVFYLVSGFGVTVGFHRHFTHGAFRARRWLRVTLAVAGSLGDHLDGRSWHNSHHADPTCAPAWRRARTARPDRPTVRRPSPGRKPPVVTHPARERTW
jgi:fatty-acid desaturase